MSAREKKKKKYCIFLEVLLRNDVNVLVINSLFSLVRNSNPATESTVDLHHHIVKCHAKKNVNQMKNIVNVGRQK